MGPDARLPWSLYRGVTLSVNEVFQQCGLRVVHAAMACFEDVEAHTFDTNRGFRGPQKIESCYSFRCLGSWASCK